MTPEEQRLAIIDLGTNTFHLLIVERSRNGVGFEVLQRQRVFVNLAEDGISHIGKASWDRATATMQEYANVLGQLGINSVRATGTAAFRRASNSTDLVQKIQADTGIAVEIIPGRLEAEFIAAGVSMVIPPDKQNILIMDIGGGSVEFIIRIGSDVKFVDSQPIGVAVLYDLFHKTEPISREALDVMDEYLDAVLTPLWSRMKRYPDLQLIGASGTFEVLDSALKHQLEQGPYAEFQYEDFLILYEAVSRMTLEERLNHPAIPTSRARYIVVAMHLIYYMMSRMSNRTGGISQFAMKEGIAKRWFNI